MTRTLLNVLALGLFALACSACAHARFDTPREFAELDEHSDYTQRTTSAHGVVMAVREVDAPRDTSLSFWSEAITQRMTGGSGYALLSTRDLRARSGEKGQLLAFGHDQNGQTFDYWVAIFPLKKRVVLVELGGRRERFAAVEPELTRALASLTLP
jgi:hypothetical protein